jgi:hypothetical protein
MEPKIILANITKRKKKQKEDIARYQNLAYSLSQLLSFYTYKRPE